MLFLIKQEILSQLVAFYNVENLNWGGQVCFNIEHMYQIVILLLRTVILKIALWDDSLCIFLPQNFLLNYDIIVCVRDTVNSVFSKIAHVWF